MKPQQALRITLTTFLFVTFLTQPIRSSETKHRQTFSIQTDVNTESFPDKSFTPDLTVPVNNKKHKEADHNSTDLFRHKRHADEDRHEHHHHHFDKVKGRKRIINFLSALMLKIIISISYFSILLCTYMSIAQH